MINHDKILELVENELAEAQSNWPAWHSTHEGYAVTKEEYEELETELKAFNKKFKNLWEMTKQNMDEGLESIVFGMKEDSIKIIGEAIQLAAMVQRYEIDILAKTNNLFKTQG